MTRCLHRTAALGAAVLLCALGVLSPSVAGQQEEHAATHSPRENVASANLHRVRILLDGDARAVWIGDSWSLMQNAERVPYGALLTWPIEHLTAVGVGFRPGTIIFGTDYTDGDGSLSLVNAANSWQVEFDSTFGQQYFGLPVLDVSAVRGEPGLILDQAWPGVRRIQSMNVSSNAIERGDLPPFSGSGDLVRGRVLYYATRSARNQCPAVQLFDGDKAPLGSFDLLHGARPFWHLGEDADQGTPRDAIPSQINAIGTDVWLNPALPSGARVVLAEDDGDPLVGSGTTLACAGSVFYLADESGTPLDGLYHSGLSGNSWSFAGISADAPSTGGKTYSDEQLLHWLDVSTIDRAQTPVVILHIATEAKPIAEIELNVRRVLGRFRASFAAIGTAPPRFLLIGSYMHRIPNLTLAECRQHIEELDMLYASLATTEPDCAFVSLYEATDGVFLTNDAEGGAGAQQASRDWLDTNGWASITYGGESHALSSTENGGLDGELIVDGVHCGSTPAAAFFAKLIGDAIAASTCPGDFNADHATDTRDVLAFLNAWAADDPDADIDGNGVIDSRDVLAFLNAWNAGC